MEEKQQTNLLQSVAWIVGVLSIAVILALVLGAGRQNPAADEGTSEAATGTAEATAEVAITEAPCMVTAGNTDVQVLGGPPGAAPMGLLGVLMGGQSAPVKAIDDTQNDNVFYQIEFVPPDGSAPSADGWVSGNQGVTESGDCASVPRVGVQQASACSFVAEGSDFKVYDAPNGANSLGLIYINQSTQVYSFMTDSAGQRWIEVDFEGQHGWIFGEGDFTFSGDCANASVNGEGVPSIGISGGPTGCDLTAGDGGSPVFSMPVESGDTLIGRLDDGVSAPILARTQTADSGGGMEWYQIEFGSAIGWTYVTERLTLSGTCDAIPYLDVTPGATPTLNPNQLAMLCQLITGPDDIDVHSTPDASTDVVATLPLGTQVNVISYAKRDGLWYEIEGNAVYGFIQTDLMPSTVSGDACNLPIYHEPVPQVEFTGEPDYVIGVPGDVGTEQRFTQTLPSNDGKSQHIVEFNIEIPQAEGNEGRRFVEYYVGCEDTDNAGVLGFHWGWWDSTDLPFTCGDKTVSDGLLWSDSTVHFVLMGDPQHPLTYTFIITVSAYPGTNVAPQINLQP